MKLGSKVATLLLVGLLSSTSLVTLAYADAAGPAYATQTQMLKMSEEGRTALKSAQAARIDLFNNRTDAAKTEVEKGIQVLEAAATTLKDVMIPGNDAADAKAEYLPFDTKMGLAEAFVVTPEKQVALDKAKGLFEANTPTKAIDVLREAGVEVTVSTALLPGEAALNELHHADKLIEKGNFFEAIVVLKTIEDSVVVRTYGIDAIPVQGAAG